MGGHRHRWVWLLPYWTYKVRSSVNGWRGWRVKTWAWRRHCPACNDNSFPLVRLDTTIGGPW